MNTDIGQIHVDGELVIRKFSPVAGKIINLKPDDIGKSLTDFTFSNKSFNFTKDLITVIKKGNSFEKEISLQENEYYLMLICPAFSQDNTTEGAIINFINITETKKLSLFMGSVFNSSTSGIVAVRPVRDEKGKIVDFEYTAANQSAENILHTSRNEMIGGKMLQMFPQINQPFIRLCKEVIKTSIKKQDDYFNAKTKKWFEIVIVKMMDSLVITFTDITDKKQFIAELENNYKKLESLSEELKESNKKLEQSNFDLLQFASVASHDLKEPLRKIHAFGNILETRLKKKLDETEVSYLDRIINATSRMQTMIEDVLNFSKLSNQGIPYKKFDLGTLINNIIEDFQITINENNALIRVNTLPEIIAGEGQIRQVFQNLLSNALKFNDKKIPLIDITNDPLNLKIAKELKISSGEYTCITIKDNGMGFENEFHEKIFGIFEKLNGMNFEGSGIGLAIAKRIIDNHGGFIRAAGMPGKGAIFQVILPHRKY